MSQDFYNNVLDLDKQNGCFCPYEYMSDFEEI